MVSQRVANVYLFSGLVGATKHDPRVAAALAAIRKGRAPHGDAGYSLDDLQPSTKDVVAALEMPTCRFEKLLDRRDLFVGNDEGRHQRIDNQHFVLHRLVLHFRDLHVGE